MVYTNRGLRYYACYRPTGRRVRLDRPEYNGGLQVYGPAGRYLVTIASQSPRYEDGGNILTVGMFNVRTGAYYFIARHGYVAWSQAVDAVVLRPSGSLAWLTNTGRQTDEYRLDACQFPSCYSRYRRAVNARSLDRGQIPPDSVVPDGEILRWTNSGQQRSTALSDAHTA